MAQLVKAKRAENIPVLSGRLVLVYGVAVTGGWGLLGVNTGEAC